MVMVEPRLRQTMDGGSSEAVTRLTEEKQSQGFDYGRAYETLASLPMEFYHYYHGSNNDMGTLIEVRRTWDAYLRPGGSRIPGNWVQPPPPANDVLASYLVRPKRSFGKLDLLVGPNDLEPDTAQDIDQKRIQPAC